MAGVSPKGAGRRTWWHDQRMRRVIASFVVVLLLPVPAFAEWSWWMSLQGNMSDSESNRCRGPCDGIRVRQTEDASISGGVYYTGWRLEPGISAETDYGAGGLARLRWRSDPVSLAVGYGLHQVWARASYAGDDQGSPAETTAPYAVVQLDVGWFTLRYSRASPSHTFHYREALDGGGFAPSERVRVDSTIETWWLGVNRRI